MILPVRWTDSQIAKDVQHAVDLFRRERMQEPLEAYLEAFDEYQGFIEELLDASVDLTQIDKRATQVLTNPNLLEAFRYVAGPPLSADDLRTLGEAVLTPTRLRSDPAMAGRIVEIVRIGLDGDASPGCPRTESPPKKKKRLLSWRPRR